RRAPQVFNWFSTFLDELASLVDQRGSNLPTAEQSFHRDGFVWHNAGAGDAHTDDVTGPVPIEAHLHGGAGDRKVTCYAFQFKINSLAVATRHRKNNLAEDLIAFQCSRIGERKEISRRDHSFASWTNALHLRVERQNHRPIVSRGIRLRQTSASRA